MKRRLEHTKGSGAEMPYLKEVREASWAFGNLWRQEKGSRCKALIPDTLLFSGLEPVRWLFTSRNGEIMKKREVSLSVVQERFRKLSDRDNQEGTLIVRYKDGRIEKRSLEMLGKILKGEMHSNNVESIQLIQQNRIFNSIYRNKYTVVNDTGRTSFKIEKKSPLGTGDNSNVECRATRLNQILNSEVQAIVRFLETTNQVRIIECSMDFLFDDFESPMLVWISQLITVSGIAANNLSLVGLPSEISRLSGEIGGLSYGFPKERTTRPNSVLRSNSPAKPISRDPFQLDIVAMADQVNKAVMCLEKSDDLGTTQHGSGNKYGPTGTKDFNLAIASGKDKEWLQRTMGNQNSKFPTPFNCHGDFCDFLVKDPHSLSSDSKKLTPLDIVKQLLTENELKELDKEIGLNLLCSKIDSSQKDLSEHCITFKSISLSRQEKRDILRQKGGVSERKQLRNLERPKLSQLQRISAAENAQRNGVPIGQYYAQVRVCRRCYQVYSTLDKAREVLQRGKEREDNQKNSITIKISEDLANRLSTKGGKRGRSQEKSASRCNGLPSRTPSPIRSARKYMQNHGLARSKTSHAVILNSKSCIADIIEKEQKYELCKSITSNLKPTREESRKLQNEREALRHFGDLDKYLRGTSKRKYNRQKVLSSKEKEGIKSSEKETNKIRKPLSQEGKPIAPKVKGVCARILLVEEDKDIREATKQMLESKHYIVTDVDDGPMALECIREQKFDLMLISRTLPTLSGVEVTKIVRQRENRQNKLENPLTSAKQRLPIVAFTSETAREDLALYMEIEMDGCVSKPVDEEALFSTVTAATPHHEPIIISKVQEAKNSSEIPRMRPTTTGLVSSSTVALRTLPVPVSQSRVDEGDVSVGMFQMDASTVFPYVVMGKQVKGSRLFNFVVVNDFFDTYETMQIFFSPILAKFPGILVLLFNCPGQAFTEWSNDVVLNNSYQAACLEKLLHHVDYNGTGEFHTRGPYAAPFFLMGFGNGGNIAMCHSIQYKPPRMRACLLLNGFSHVDPHLAGVLHDCMNVFSCSPSTRPDLPVYFYTRFIFSASYLTKVSTPLALNLYTAVHNPITLQGRIQICKGALSHVDLRDDVRMDHQPIILVQSSQGGLVKPLHAEVFVQVRGGESRTIRECLKERKKPCVIWLRSGHEMFQECRRPISDLLEQLATGYHEKHDVGFLPTGEIGENTEKNRRKGIRTSNRKGRISKAEETFFEDRFIDNVLGTLRQVREERNAESNPFVSTSTDIRIDDKYGANNSISGPIISKPSSSHPHGQHNQNQIHYTPEASADESPEAEHNRWNRYRDNAGLDAQKSMSKSKTNKDDYKQSKQKALDRAARKAFGNLKLGDSLEQFSFNPESRFFDGRDRNSPKVSRDESDAVLKKPMEVPEVREFMQWRIARNRKRLAQLEIAANQIQRGWRAYLARTLVQRMRAERAALFIQTRWRAKLGRDIVTLKKKELWASTLVQRNWRGKAGRSAFKQRKLEYQAAQNLQRIYRGKRGKQRVYQIRNSRHIGATVIQNMVRAKLARNLCWKMRIERNAAIDIQRVVRGHGGRIRARVERDKYLFSKAQSQGIDFGRQMLLEHKLHGTRLQSEVSLLTREKLDNEEKVEALLSEIAEFDKGIGALEKEMHELTNIETEAKGLLDEEAKIELREQKIRLDKEFAVMLGKIADRKEKLQSLEANLQKIDRTRQMKEEELRDLERKLVVLLEEQQHELEQIKRRQEKRGELIMDTAEGLGTNSTNHSHPSYGNNKYGQVFASGPSPQQQQQANTLMQSSEELMKFGFMSMSLTYFSSMNMIRAMRKVGAINTVLSGPGAKSPEELLKSIGVRDPGMVSEGDRFVPKLEKGQMPGQEKTSVSAWSVVDVGDWLETLALGQYRESFRDAAIDGAFLYDLNDEDLRNTLGIEHGLHRKKILSSIKRLRRTEQQMTTNIVPSLPSSVKASTTAATTIPVQQNLPVLIDDIDDVGPGSIAAGLRPEKLLSLVRHGKVKELSLALKDLQDKEFDKNDIAHQYVDGFGTQYSDELNRLQWHINKSDDHGNTLLTVACQNGHMKVSLLLVQKGANPDHQNNQGQTPLHYAMTYNFYELGAWLADSKEGAGANDQLVNMYELSPYDGLVPESNFTSFTTTKTR